MRRIPVALGLAASFLSAAALAQPPSPITPARFSFPGSVSAAGSATSAALALADRWLGDEPFDNPALRSGPTAQVSPVIQHTSRQDLSAANREFDDQGTYVDFAGAWAALPIGSMLFAGYLEQPTLRLEDNAYVAGTALDPGTPATVKSSVTSRELRGGVAISFPLGPARLGAAAEWSHRDDVYQTSIEDGSPSSGVNRAEFSGDGVGGVIGASVDGHALGRGLSLGASLRFLPELSITGTQSADLVSGSSRTPIDATRVSGWEGGLSARLDLDPAFRVYLAGAGRGAAEWKGFDVTAGQAASWAIAGEYHDARDPWTVRFGLGAEQQSDVPEAHAALYGVGFGWRFGEVRAEIGLTHRVIEREGAPQSYDERVVGTLRLR
jgi:hypothetical protein